MKNKRIIWATIVLGVLVYVLMSIYADFDDLMSAMREFPPELIPALLTLTISSIFLRFIKWEYFLRKAGVTIPRKDNLFIYLSGISMTITPGKSGEMVWKGWLIKEIHGHDLSKTVPAVIIERVTDVLGLIILILLGLTYYHPAVYLIVPLVMAVFGLYALIKSERISRKAISILEKRAGKYADNIRTMHQAFESMMAPKGFFLMTILSAIIWFLECLVLYLVVLGFDESISPLIAAFIFSFASLAGGLSMLPGGLGVAEVSISGLLELFDINATIAVGTAIIVRMATLWFSVIFAALIYFLFRGKVISRD